MGLEEFIDGLEDDESTSNDSSSNNSPSNRKEYSGDDDLLNITPEHVKNILKKTGYTFTKRQLPLDGTTYCIESSNGSYVLYVETAFEKPSYDCITISAVESTDLYDVIKPEHIFPTAGWEDRVLTEVDNIVLDKSILEYCPRCDSVLVFKQTNRTDKQIKGCSDYPNCHYRTDIS